jgi:Fe-S cluster assembly ATP-binding protein
MKRTITIKGLEGGIEGKDILHGLDLEIGTGEIHALMGPNGSGKSTLANLLMGNPAYKVTGGSVELDGKDLLALSPGDRALHGLYLAFQYPVEIPGVTVGKFLKRASELNAAARGQDSLNVSAYIKKLREAMDFMEMDQAFINRYLNQGFSGGEKKRMEVLQMLMLEPSFAIMDETDSGLDIDALKVVAKGVNRLRDSSRVGDSNRAGQGFGALIITHYRRILEQIRPDFVHVMYQGRIVTSGGPELIEKLEAKGYDWVAELAGDTAAARGAPKQAVPA